MAAKKSTKKSTKKLTKKSTKKSTKKTTKKSTKKSTTLFGKLASSLPKAWKPTAPKPKAKTKPPKKTFEQIGAEGEQQVYDQLVALFGRDFVFRNVYVRRRSGFLTEIDLLAVHPTGVYVVESKNYSGLVVGDCNQKDWEHIKSNDYRRTFYSPVAQNKGHVDALREACEFYLGFVPPMLSLLVFPDRCELQITRLPVGLRCCRLSQLQSTIASVVRQVNPVLTPAHLQAIVPLFYQSQKSMLPAQIQEQHKRDVATVRSWAGR